MRKPPIYILGTKNSFCDAQAAFASFVSLMGPTNAAPTARTLPN